MRKLIFRFSDPARVSKFPPVQLSLTFSAKRLALSPRTKKIYCSLSRLLSLFFNFFILGIPETGPKSEFDQISTENECSHYWETSCSNFAKVNDRCRWFVNILKEKKKKLLIKIFLINSCQPKYYGVYLHAKSACNKRIRVIRWPAL